MDKKKLTLDDIFNDDEFGILDSKIQKTTVKTDEDRLVDVFEEINVFFEKNGREPNRSSMSEYSLLAKLKNFRDDEVKKRIVKPFDRHNLLGYVEMETESIDDILESDDFGLLNTADDLSIFKFEHTPKLEDRKQTDFVAKRTTLSEKEFSPYEKMFHKVHQEIKEGKRKIVEFSDVEKHLHAGRYYIADGVMLYLESVDFEDRKQDLSKNTTRRKDGRTRTIFENGTVSNMLYRSVGKAIYNGGRKMVTQPKYELDKELFVSSGLLEEKDVKTGWIYVLKSKSKNPEITNIKNLYKIGFSSTSVDERIKNAQNEATYLYDEVQKIASYIVYNRDAITLEKLLHKFFAKACLDIEFTTKKNQRINPREWFVVPLEVIEEAITLLLKDEIIGYHYDIDNQIIVKQ